MTKRNPVSAIQNIWSDAQQVDNTDLTLEQDYNNTINSSLVDNHIGTGVLPEVLVQNILFDSSLTTGFLDGVAIQAQNQPADNNLGNQLEIQLINSKVSGKKHIKVGIIGLDFQSNLQYETFVFKTNETQITHRHFTKILVLLFNDFIGNPSLSFNLGGKIIIKEANPVTLSRNPIMVAQDIQPNLFFRDFFLNSPTTLQTFLQLALPFYNIDTLGIFVAPSDTKLLLNNDVTTQIGEKFIATTNNIQKVTFLLSVRNLDINNTTDLAWNGDLIVSIYPLQSGLECPTDVVPNLPIDFAPSNIPLAQLSINYTSLSNVGVILDSVPQPVDFIFSNSSVATNNVLIPGNYYAVSLKRSGSANKCDILIASGNNLVKNSRITTFTGTLWVDIPEENLWFQIWTDAAKVSDGQAYESGHGIIIPKTNQDPDTLNTIDYSLENLQFTGNDVFSAVLSANTQESTPIPDQRTGNPVLTRQQFVPQINLLNTIDLTNLEKASDPLIVGVISDKNIKFINNSSSIFNANLHSATLANDELVIKIIDDPTDTGRFDSSVVSLQTNFVSGDFIGARIIPNSNNSGVYYRIASARMCSMIIGDVNGDGIIDSNDLDLLNTYLNYDLNISPPTTTSITTDGYSTTFVNGYPTYIKSFTGAFGINFQIVSPSNIVIASGNDGVLVANPNDPRLAQFGSFNVKFNSLVSLSGYKIVLLTSSPVENYGGFDITSLDTINNVLTIRKILLNGETFSQMLRADINGDFHITYNDGYLLQSYIDRIGAVTPPTNIFPGPAGNAYLKIGTSFNILRFKVEKFIDRFDDYSPVTVNRANIIHPLQDIYLSDGYFANHNFYSSPVLLTFQKQLTWDESLVISNSGSKLVPSVFTTLTGLVQNKCFIDGVQCSTYPSQLDFDPGKNDYFVPNNLILGKGGELQRPDGNFYKVDFEIGTIVLEIPDGLFGLEKTINIIDDFIADYTGNGITRLGFPAMRFADCSLVTASSLSRDQLRFSVAVQSFSPNTSGLSVDGYSGVIVDGKMGVAIDYSTGLLTLNFTNLFQDTTLQTLSTKVQINVFLKKGGFNNTPIFVDSTKVQNMLNLISVFSGANEAEQPPITPQIVTGGPANIIVAANTTDVIVITFLTGPITVTLQGVHVAGHKIVIKNSTSNINNITINVTNPTGTIDGAATKVISGAYVFVELLCFDGPSGTYLVI